MKTAVRIAAAAAVLAIVAPQGRAAVVFVRPPTDCPVAGDGTAYDCAADAGGPGALNDLDAAQGAVGPGDVLTLDGTWMLTDYVVFHASGSAEAPLRVTTYALSSPAHFVGSFDACLFYFLGDHLEIDHLVFDSAYDNGVLLGENSETAAHLDHRFHHNALLSMSNGISLRGIEDVEVFDNIFLDIGSRTDNQGHCLYVAQGTRNARLYRNLCVAKDDVFASHCFHVFHAEPPGPAEDVELHDNVCSGFTTGAGVYSGSTGILVYSNTFIAGGDYGGLRCTYGGSQAGFYNNIVVGNPAYMGSVNFAEGCDVALNSNVYFQTDGSPRFSIDEAPVDAAAWLSRFDSASLFEDPLIVDPGARDFHLDPASPAIDAGDGAHASDTDFYGQPRISGGRIDIGAVEHQVSPPEPEESEPVDETEPAEMADEVSETADAPPEGEQEAAEAAPDETIDTTGDPDRHGEGGCSCRIPGA
jgi:hypothetical protein